jgi:hypothetical protein
MVMELLSFYTIFVSVIKSFIMRYLILLLLVIGYTAVSGQDIGIPGEEDLAGIRVVRSENYSGQGLYGYIDGGADLYIEYGFIKLYLTEYQWNNESIKTEVWLMKDSPSAFGIYSLSHSSCTLWNTLSSFSCTSRYQAAAACGPFFISVTNSSGTSSAMDICGELVKKIIEMNPQDIWYMPALFQSPKLSDYKNTIRYFNGPLGVQNGIPVMADLLEDLEFEMYTIITADPGNAVMLARLVFPDQGSVNTFLSRAQLNPIDFSSDPVPVSNNMYRSWYKVNDTKIIYMESPSGTINLKDYIPKTPDPYWLNY